MCELIMPGMLTFRLLVLVFLFVKSFSQSIDTVDLLQTGTFTWEGSDPDSNQRVNVTAQNYSIAVTIKECDIGNSDSRPNKEYLILRNGYEDPISIDNGRRFAYIKKPKTIYFFSSSVFLELNTPSKLAKTCTVIFEKGDHEDATLPPVTTTEAVPTYGPGVSKYSTVLISGRTIQQFNENKSLVLELKDDITAMANNYTTVQGFCLMKDIESKDVEIYTLEQCPTQWPNFHNCVRLVYAIPVQLNHTCTLWDGYQINKEQLDLMWSESASKYLKDTFAVYEQPEINNVVTWWVICMVFLTLLFAITIIAINVVWKRRQSIERAQAFDIGYPSDTRKISELSLTPLHFQPVPPMFRNTDTFEENNGEDNAGFQYNILHEN